MRVGDINFLGDRWGKAGLVQVQHAVVSTLISGSTIIPQDNTIPQNTEGYEILTCSITPKNTSNLLLVIANVAATYYTTDARGTVALFQDSTAAALAAVPTISSVNSNPASLIHKMTAGTTSSTTFKIRYGPNSAETHYINSILQVAGYGGVFATTLTIFEYAQ